MERYTLVLLSLLLAGCLGGSVTGQEALQTVQATDSYQQLGADIETTVWEINDTTRPATDANITQLMNASEQAQIIYGLTEFTSLDPRSGYIVRATAGSGTGRYYHVGTDGTIHGSISMTDLRANITARLRQEVDAIQEEIERQQSCSAIDIEIQEAGFDTQTSEAYVVAQHTGRATIETLTIRFLGDSTAMDTREKTDIIPGDVISAVFDTTEPPTTVRITIPGCPEAGTQQTLQ